MPRFKDNSMAYRDITDPTFETDKKTAPDFEFNLDKSLEHIAHWLPAQAPIKDFVHHNTLHAVQEHPFHEGVAIAAKVFGARSYLPLADYQSMHQKDALPNRLLTGPLSIPDAPI